MTLVGMILRLLDSGTFLLESVIVVSQCGASPGFSPTKPWLRIRIAVVQTHCFKLALQWSPVFLVDLFFRRLF